MSMCANKHKGIRAALCSDTFSARMTRAHNDANLLCMGARVIGSCLALDIVDAFLGAEFEGGRHKVRVDMMMDEGLLDEVKGLYDRGLLTGATASAAIGYKELVDHIESRCTLPEAIDNIKLASRRYAKRQLTWFRHEPSCETIFVDKPEGGMRDSSEILAEAREIYEKYKEKFTKECTDNEGI